jgi:hypothetical protein
MSAAGGCSHGSTSAVGGCCRFSRGSTNASLQMPPHRYTFRTERRQLFVRQKDRQKDIKTTNKEL